MQWREAHPTSTRPFQWSSHNIVRGATMSALALKRSPCLSFWSLLLGGESLVLDGCKERFHFTSYKKLGRTLLITSSHIVLWIICQWTVIDKHDSFTKKKKNLHLSTWTVLIQACLGPFILNLPRGEYIMDTLPHQILPILPCWAQIASTPWI
jgi:hypothetical protein